MLKLRRTRNLARTELVTGQQFAQSNNIRACGAGLASTMLLLSVIALAACGGTDKTADPGAGGAGGDNASGGNSDSQVTGGAGKTGARSDGSSGASGNGTGGTAANTPADFGEKIDLLFVVDNSVSMADKQEILVRGVPSLVGRLVDPLCVKNGDPSQTQPSPGASSSCPDGFHREFLAVDDIHVGVISSSLGGFGGTFCSEAGSDYNPEQNDRAHLIGTVRHLNYDTWNDSGFLAWDPAQAKSPPGEDDSAEIKVKFRDMVAAVGDNGCGFEASLESWYRFLVDPSPPLDVSVQDNRTVVSGVDEELLAQREAFLRPDSVVVIVMLTDENDCSVRLSGSGWAVATSEINGRSFRMPRATSACETDPNDECCRPCGVSSAPEGCPTDAEDPACETGNNLSESEDALNLRCYDQTRRFGFSLLHPTSRYVDALHSATIEDRNGNIVDNPLLNAKRNPSHVFLAGIIGVPWQDIATPESLSDPRVLEYMSWRELNEAGRWRMILGVPERNIGPSDPLMLETPEVRSGRHPITGEKVADGTDPLGNSINGHDYDTGESPNDLQYACIFRLDTPLDCSGNSPPSGCDCTDRDLGSNKPLCYDNAAGIEPAQFWGKAYPGRRQLQVLRDLRGSSIVASICPKNPLSEATDPYFGYNPTVDAIVDRLKTVDPID